MEDIVAALQPGPQPLDAMGSLVAARDQLATQPARLAGIPAAEVAPEDVRNPAVQRVMDVLAAPRHVAEHIMGGLATLPQRFLDASTEDVQHLGDHSYTPRSIGPALETAMTMMGGAGVVPAEANTLRSGLSVVKSGMAERPTSIFDTIAEKYPQVKIDGSPARSPNDYATLSRIQVPEELRGQGLATQAMRDLVAEADKSGTNLALSPSADWGASKSRLQDFYSRFGFVPNAGRTKDFATRETMIRSPKPKFEGGQ